MLFLGLTVGTFYYFDPFKIIKNYPQFYVSEVGYNEDFIITENFLKNPKSYNSFLLGSSRAGCGYRLNDWATFLNKDDTPYKFTASNESIFGIVGKVKLIDELNVNIDNAILVIDNDVTFKHYENSSGHIFIKHPEVSKESYKSFISEFLKNYIFSGFFIRYLDYQIFHTKRKYMNGYLHFSKRIGQVYKPFYVENLEEEIKKDSANYYKKRANSFSKKKLKETISSNKIDDKGYQMLEEIYAIFKKHNTKYKVVVSPLYNKKKMNKHDMDALNNIFGKENVFNFSGGNEITNNKHNYYEASHYRQKIGLKIMQQIYE